MNQYANATACKSGHRYVAGSFFLRKGPSGQSWRRCKICARLASRRFLAANPVTREMMDRANELRRKRYATPHGREVIVAQKKRYKPSAESIRRHIAKTREWMRNTEKGRELYARARYRLPLGAPKNLIKAFELLNTLRKELRNGHKRT